MRQLPQRGSHWQAGQKAVYFYNSVELIILLEKALSKGVFNYLHLSADSLYKSSIDNGPIYSIIDPTNAQMGKSNAGYPLFRELPDDARQQAARRGILPEQPAEGRFMGRLLSSAGGGR